MLTMDYTLVGKFPAPCEVDRELYKEDWLRLLEKAIVSGPYRG